MSCPHLWTNITIQDMSKPFPLDPGIISILRLHLTLSKNHPLTIKYRSNRNPHLPIPTPVLLLLKEQARRWGDVTLRLTTNLFDSLMAPPSIRGHLPSLHSLHLHREDFSTRIYPILSVFAKAPALKNITLTSWHQPLQSVPMPWHQLTSYSADSSAGVMEVIRSAPRLRDLIIFADDGTQIWRQDKFIHRSLEKVHILEWGFPTLLECLILPSLKELKVKYLRSYYHAHAVPRLKAILHSTKLEVLHVCHLKEMDATTLIVALSNMTCIRELRVDEWISSELHVLLTALTVVEKADSHEAVEMGRCLPTLETLVLKGILGGSLGRLVDMVESRWYSQNATVPLRSLCLRHFHASDDVQALPRLLSLRDHGLQLRLV
jgi:hypothetical protein